SLGEAPNGGAKALWLLSRFSKVTRRKGGTISGRYKKMDMYATKEPPLPQQRTCPPIVKRPSRAKSKAGVD
ncbi:MULTISPECIES: hypothetical protein, partial [unclassified Pseudomonas]|uniref:hypothetical protein n=1 Tax=unclassified Pseudomonas TaxID=196821 RepID=UPI001A91576C